MSRSISERAWEHQNDRDQLKPDSHLVKHIIDKYEGENIRSMKFGVSVVQNLQNNFRETDPRGMQNTGLWEEIKDKK